MNSKEISSLFMAKINSVEAIKEHGLNFVYKIGANDKLYILKIYRKRIDFTNSNNLINYLKQNNINTIITSAELEKGDYIYKLYPYIEGKHVYEYDDNQIDRLTDILSILYKNNIKSGNSTILDKCNNYFSYLLNKKDKVIDDSLYESLFQSYKKLSFDKDEFTLIHGDLSNTNLIWDKDVSIIDFDESILAPKEYELSSCIIKTCFDNGIFNIEQAKKIINSLNNKINIDYEKFRKSWELYIIKVIIEKLYYYELSSTKQNSNIKGNDHWSYWYDLYRDESILSELFNYKRKDIKDSGPSIILKDDYKGKVRIINDKDKRIIDKTEYESNEKLSKDEYNLVNMLYHFGLNDLEFYNLFFDKDKAIKQFSFCEGITKNNPSDEDLKQLSIKLFNIHQFLLHNDYLLDNEQGNIIEKLCWCLDVLRDSEYSKTILGLLDDEAFLNSIRNERKVITLDDLHRDNVLYNNNGITLIDFYGLKKYPESLQLASLITNQLLLYGDDRMNIIINNWPKEIDYEQLVKLIKFRIIKGLAFYEKYLSKYNNDIYDNKAKTLKKSLNTMV